MGDLRRKAHRQKRSPDNVTHTVHINFERIAKTVETFTLELWNSLVASHIGHDHPGSPFRKAHGHVEVDEVILDLNPGIASV